jgi:hypothetical protein
MRNAVAILTLLAAAACGDGGGNGDRSPSEGLVRFRYGLLPGLGFCAGPGMLYRADLARNDHGGFTLTGSRLDAGNRGEGSCLPNVGSGGCLVERTATRALTDADARKILAALDGGRIETTFPTRMRSGGSLSRRPVHVVPPQGSARRRDRRRERSLRTEARREGCPGDQGHPRRSSGMTTGNDDRHGS